MVFTQLPWKVGHPHHLIFFGVLLVLANLKPTSSFNWSSPASSSSLQMLQCRRLSGVAARRSPSLFTGRRALPTSTSLDLTTPTSSNVNAGVHRFSRSALYRDYRMQLFSSASTVAEPASTAEDVVNGHQETSTETTSTTTTTDSVEAELKALGIRSRQVPGGNWNLEDPVGWAETFGSRSPSYKKERLEKERIANLQPGDEGYFDVKDLQVQGVTIVRTKEQAKLVLEKLNNADPSIFHACDTEVMDIDLKSVGPVGNGFVTCVSIYSGPDFDYGLGDGPGTCLWIDNLDDAYNILQEFKGWFEDERFLKVWHNYGFDRHEMWNEGINVLGFGGDTMHMARLQDSSRSKWGVGGGYGLEALTNDLLKRRKKPMKEIFGIPRLRKDGSEGSLVDMPAIEVMQRDPKHRTKWIEYSCYDAQGTWLIREELQKRLEIINWYQDYNLFEYYIMHMRPFGEVLTDMERRGIRVDARNYLAGVEKVARADRVRHSRTFRDWAATKIGPDGLALNPASSTQLGTLLFGGAKNSKTGEYTETVRVFKVPREEIPDEALEAYQRQDQENAKRSDHVPQTSEFDALDKMKAVQLKTLCKERGLKVAGKKADLKERLIEHFIASAQPAPPPSQTDDLAAMPDEDLRDSLTARGQSSAGTREELLDRLKSDIEFTSGLLTASAPEDRDGYVALSEALEHAAKNEGGAIAEYLNELKQKSTEVPKYIALTLTSLGFEPEKFTAGGAPSVTADALRKLAGDPFADPPRYGTAHERFGKEGCEALFSLCAIGSIDTMIANFLTSLQVLADEQDRVHCSLNLNTETGRLSSRRPNLQNQPALEKDTYKIRQAFQASPGNNLIVADYGQLELRILASITNCKSMIDAFASGGDFHSRTALDMFPYVQQAVDSGECLLEWDYSQGDPPKPLLKDLFASERRKAKTLNFSIAYGKTAHGLSADWGVSTDEASKMLDAWYQARPEVLKWQQQTKATARKEGITRTIMGRYRQLPDALPGGTRKLLGHSERASINTPIQGGAADIAMMAMIKINQSPKLKKLGWILLLQIHDEVILEGPEETSEEAFEEVLLCMQEPWVFGLDETAVPLLVDGSCNHKTWYDAK